MLSKKTKTTPFIAVAALLWYVSIGLVQMYPHCSDCFEITSVSLTR